MCWEQQNHASYIKMVVNRKSINFWYGWELLYLTYVVFSRRCCNEKIIENISVSIYMSQFKITCKTRYENYLMNCLSTVSVFHARICNVYNLSNTSWYDYKLDFLVMLLIFIDFVLTCFIRGFRSYHFDWDLNFFDTIMI